MINKENILINYEGATGGDFLRSCLWILKNPDKDLYIDHNNCLRLDYDWLFKIIPTGQVVPNPNVSRLMDLLRWPKLANKRRRGLKMQANWGKYLKYEYDIQSINRNLDSDSLNFNVDIQITHDPWEVNTERYWEVKNILKERDHHISEIFNHKWDHVYWIFNQSLEDTAWSLYFDSVKNIYYDEDTDAIIEDAKRRLEFPKWLIKGNGIKDNNIISHGDLLDDKIHTFFNLEKTDIYEHWYDIYSKVNKLKNPPTKYYELLELIKSNDLNVV